MEKTVLALLIDDDEAQFVLLRAYSNKISGFNVQFDWANSYSEGLKKLLEGRHHVCFLDFVLGSDSGLDLLQEAVQNQCQVPILLLTDANIEGLDARALKAGAVDFLLKRELSPDRLSRAIRFAIQRGLFQKENQETERRIRNQNKALFALTKNEVIVKGDWEGTLKEITEISARAVNVERVGVWLMNDARNELSCQTLFEAGRERHSKGARIVEEDYPTYFQALKKNRFIDAHDALSDPRTVELSESYLKPLGISSLLDIPIWLGGENIGVICHEHVGPKREWTWDEQQFAASLAGFVSQGMEIRQRIQAEEKYRKLSEYLEKVVTRRTTDLEKSREFLKNLMGDLPGMVYQCNYNQKMPFEFASEGSVSLTGYLPDELIGKSYFDLVPEEIREKVRREIRASVLEPKGTAVTHRILTKGGELRWGMSQNRYDCTEENSVLVGFLTDVTLRINAEERVREKEEEIRLLLEFVGEAIYRIDRDGNCTFANPLCLELLGYENPGDLIGKNMHRLIHHTKTDGTPYPAEECPIYKAFRTNQKIHLLDETLWRKNGTPIPVDCRAHPITKEGKVMGAVVSFNDLTKRKEFAKLLHQSEKLATIGTLSAGVAHEILNPLNIISTLVQMMTMESSSPETMNNLEEILTQVKRATKITNNLRMFARPKNQEIGPVNLNELFDRVSSLMERDLNLDNILIVRDFDPEVPPILADEDQIAQIFLNLLTNARDAMVHNKGGRITVQTRPTENGIVFRFSDNGPGIPPEIIPKIFDPFFSTKDPGKGTGLGLSILQSIVRSQGGTVQVESQPGQGAAFVIQFPRIEKS